MTNTKLEQAKAEVKAKLQGLGEDTAFESFVADSVIEKYAFEFQKLLEASFDTKQVVASGNLRDSIRVEFADDGKGFTIYMLDYYDYPNKGVRGIDFSDNAPDSKYSFKKNKGYYAISKEGRDSLKEYILSGRAKVSNKSMTKKPIGLESKKISGGQKKSLIDMQVDQLVYQIRKHGIKKTSYFDDVVNVVFKDFKETMAAAYGQDIANNITLILKGK